MNVEDLADDMLTMDGFDDCVLGVCYRFGQDDIVAYDYVKVIDKLTQEFIKEVPEGLRTDEALELAESEALEFFNYNQLGAWVGDKTPCFIYTQEES